MQLKVDSSERRVLELRRTFGTTNGRRIHTVYAYLVAMGCTNGGSSVEDGSETHIATAILHVEPVVRYCAVDACILAHGAGQLRRSGKAEIRLQPGHYSLAPEQQAIPFEFRGWGGALTLDQANRIDISSMHDSTFLTYDANFDTPGGAVRLALSTSYRGTSSDEPSTWNIAEVDAVAMPGTQSIELYFSGKFSELPEFGDKDRNALKFDSCELPSRPNDLFHFEFENKETFDLTVRSQFILIGGPRINGRLVAAKGSIRGQAIDEQRYEYLTFNINCQAETMAPPGLSILWDEKNGTCGLDFKYTIFGPVETNGYEAFLLDCAYNEIEKVPLLTATYDKSKYIDNHEDRDSVAQEK